MDRLCLLRFALLTATRCVASRDIVSSAVEAVIQMIVGTIPACGDSVIVKLLFWPA
jgi:hypothetical protein